ncbi:DUF5629 family protein [Aquipseudomonas ullengensis]|uniref:DUF5629 family protein n=1 Tax=Aquipseudomonas ullengensis TaxID=2759166 RepID=A0A7W4QA10_9GAMM|nr:DUF5629 family protein [Pseudomonas ullengensis]MBB2495194.1 DUF5629 family protein [Pseudomonas ullengensis]
MTATPTLLSELQTADMLLIDDLHAWQFDLDAQASGEQPMLRVECMDGRTRKVWTFTADAVAAASHGEGSWRIADAAGDHQLVCLGAVVADNDDDGEEDEAPAAG